MRVDIRAAFLLAMAAGLLLASPFLASPARAQTDTRGLVDRLDRLERDLNTMQSQLYRNQGGSGPTVITSPRATSGAPTTPSSGGSSSLSGDTYSRLDERLSALEQQLRDLTGQVEKANFTAGQVSTKVDRMQADNDVRFKDLEQKTSGIVPPPAGQPPATGAANQPAAAGKPDFNPTMGTPAGNLSHPGDKPSAAPAAAAPSSSGPALVGKTSAEQYDYAFGLLRAGDNDGATKAFQAFVTQHPQDPLAGNAMYWLGRIPFSQGDFETAAPLFLDAYRKYPKSAKAAESLLNVGLSMSNLGKKKEACAAIGRFNTEFPDASDNLKRQASVEKQKLGC